jgi:hypothetical protein
MTQETVYGLLHKTAPGENQATMETAVTISKQGFGNLKGDITVR